MEKPTPNSGRLRILTQPRAMATIQLRVNDPTIQEACSHAILLAQCVILPVLPQLAKHVTPICCFSSPIGLQVALDVLTILTLQNIMKISFYLHERTSSFLEDYHVSTPP